MIKDLLRSYCLHKGGYETLCVGKTHFYPQRVKLGFEEIRLYDRSKKAPGDSANTSDYHAWLATETAGRINDTGAVSNGNSWLAHPWVEAERLHPTAWTTDNAIELLERRDPTRPFFLQVGYHRPHPPLDPPLRYYEQYLERDIPLPQVGDWARESACKPMRAIAGDRGTLPDHVLRRSLCAYYAQMSHIDHDIGRLMYYLNRNAALRDNTYVIFASDHGEQLGDHGLYRKSTPFEGSARIPFVVRPPRSCTDAVRGVVNDIPVSHVDIMPTLLELAGESIPKAVEGMSLVPVITGGTPPRRDYLHGEHAGWSGWHYVTDGKEKFIWSSRTGRELFFDLQLDRAELNDLLDSPDHVGRIKLWRQRLVDTLSKRPQDGLSDGNNLIPGKALPHVRPPAMVSPVS